MTSASSPGLKVSRSARRSPNAFVLVAAAISLGSAAACIAFTISPASAATKTTKPTSGSVTATSKASETTTQPASTTVSGAKKSVKADVEDRLVELQKKQAPTLAVTKAVCPPAMASVKVTGKKGAKPLTFRCDVYIEGVPAPYDIEIRDGGVANGGSFLMIRARAIIDVSKVVEGTRLQLDAADRSSAKISCGAKKVVVANVNDQITCDVMFAKGGKETIVYIVRDLDGTISIKV